MPEGTTIYDAAKEAGIEIPVLCHDERYDPVGVCRMCVVDVGARVYAAACVRPCEDGMEVKTTTPEVEQRRGTLTQLLMADQPPTEEDPKETTTADNELLVLARRYGIEREDGIPLGGGRGIDLSNPVIAVNHDACILCDRCVRACDDIQGNDVIGRSGKGYCHPDRVRPERPDGRVVLRDLRRVRGRLPDGRARQQADRATCRSGRAPSSTASTPSARTAASAARSPTTWTASATRISFADGREQPGSKRRLCVKGRYGWDYASSPQRLTTPLIRREDSYPKGPLSGDVKGEGTRTPAQARRARGLRRGAPPLPRGELGGGARPGGRAAHRRSTPTAARAPSPASARPSARTRRPTSSRS